MLNDIRLQGTGLGLGYPGRTVIEDAAIQLRAGEVTALIGPNGSGKSTLLRALARLHRPTRGELTAADGQSVWGLAAKDFARRVTLLAQSRPTPVGVTVRDVVSYGRYPHQGRWRSLDPDGARAIGWAMEVTGVSGMASRGVGELSGGELQRVWLATCLAQNTGVVLLDEPTTFLDLRYQIEILDLMHDLARDHGVAVGVVLHDLNQAAAVADRLVLLCEGRVRAQGTPAEVLTADHLSATYGIKIEVMADPMSGRMACRPIGRHIS